MLINYKGQTMTTVKKPGRHYLNQMIKVHIHNNGANQVIKKWFPKGFWVPESMHYASTGINLWKYRSDLSLTYLKTPVGSAASGMGIKHLDMALPYLLAIISYLNSVPSLSPTFAPITPTPFSDSVSSLCKCTVALLLRKPYTVSLG